MTLVWISFLAALILMITIARKNLWLGLTTGALTLGLFNLPIIEVIRIFISTITDTSILLLAVSVGIIPLIGGALEISGLMNDLIKSIRIKSKTFLMLAPAFMGMLPMPGGALLSAPIISKVGKHVSNNDYTAINVWFRHVLILIYPLGALLACSKMANLNLYYEMLLLIPGFILLAMLGNIFLLKSVDSNHKLEGTSNLKKLLMPVLVIISAPVIHITLMSSFKNILPEIPLLIGVAFSLFLVFYFGKLPIKNLKQLSIKMKPWKFFLIIIAMFIFLNMFEASKVSAAISVIVFSKTFLIVGIGVFLGFVTGRVQVPVSIILPIFYSKFGIESMTPVVFATMFFAVFMGYIVSPVHPCVSVSLEYFHTELKDFYKKLSVPTLIAIAVVSLFSIILIG
ncbi:MAG: DUF401 family protein [Candidatus Marinimicrobia bacterium]|nr:DUF401 family protein [Candidatus Neomarinimicrobiota bacterium]